MIKSILALFSSSILGRLIGLLRFQIILFVFGQNEFSDSIIYFTTFIWLVNNFFIVPNVNSSLIADLGGNKSEYHIHIILRLIRKVTKIALLAGIVGLVLILFLNSNKGILSLDILSFVLIFLIFPLLGINEIFSLYNQYKGRYFLYSFNPVIWNLILIIGLICYWLLDITNLWLYFLFLLIAKIVSLAIQYKYTKLNLNIQTVFKKISFEKSIIPPKNIFYNLSIVIFSGISFFDLNILNIYTIVGTVTIYTIFLKIPSLLQTVISSSTLPVFFNRIVLKEAGFLKSFMQFTALSFLLFTVIAFSYLIMGEWIFEKLFNYSLSQQNNLDIYLGLLFMFVSTLAFFLIRLSVELKFQQAIFVASIIAVIIKLAATQLYTVNIRNLIVVNTVVFSIIFVTGLFSILKANHNRE